jgi:sulfur-carrier protein adenylyltransferase/sulfurtransferase
MYSLLTTSPGTRLIKYAISSDGQTYLGEDDDSLTTWLMRLTSKKPETIGQSLLLDVGAIPATKYATNKALFDWIRSRGDERDVSLLSSIAISTDLPVPVVIRVDTPDGPAFLGARLHDPTNTDGASTKWADITPDANILSLVRSRFFSDEAKMTRHYVRRVDADWLFTRGPGVVPTKLLSSHVVLVGLGSLGSSVARKLAKAGIGRMTLIDNQVLSWDNTLRHELGAWWVRASKAVGMTFLLERDFPHLRVAYQYDDWETVWNNDPGVFMDADLVISTIADWPSEAMLNVLSRTASRFPTTIYGWLESRAAAAQVLTVSEIGGCLSCGMSALGEFSDRVVAFDVFGTQRVAGCDEFFQPYSAAEADTATSLIVQAAVDALQPFSNHSKLVTWVGAKQILEDFKGYIRPEWHKEHGDEAEGRSRLVRDWPINPACALCGG